LLGPPLQALGGGESTEPRVESAEPGVEAAEPGVEATKPDIEATEPDIDGVRSRGQGVDAAAEPFLADPERGPQDGELQASHDDDQAAEGGGGGDQLGGGHVCSLTRAHADGKSCPKGVDSAAVGRSQCKIPDMDVRVGKRAQVVIPAVLRRRMGVTDGDLLHAEVDDQGRLILERVHPDPVQRLADAGRGLWGGDDPVKEQRALRDDWESAVQVLALDATIGSA